MNPKLARLTLGCLLATRAVPCAAQEEARQPSSPVSPSPVSPEEKAFSSADAMRRASEILDQIEAQEYGDKDKALYEEVAGLLKQIQAEEPAHALLPFLTGRLYAAAGRSGDAIDLLRQYTSSAEGRTDWRAFRLLGNLFLSEYPRLAKSNYDQAAALNPKEPSIQFGLSVCAAKLAAADEAVDLARSAVGNSEARPLRYYVHLTTVLANAGRWEEAVREAERAVRIAAARVQDGEVGARSLVALDAQYQLLITILQKRVSQPGYKGTEDDLRLADAIRERARLGERLAVEQALRVVEAARERAGPSVPVRLTEHYAKLLAESGRHTEAIAAWEDVLRVDPNHAPAQEALSKLRSAPP